MGEVLPGLAIEVVEPAAPASAGYRESDATPRVTVRITYDPPRSEILWAVAMIVVALTTLAGFIAWLGAGSDIEPTWSERNTMPLATLGVMVVVIFGPVLVLSMRRGRRRYVELVDGRIHTEDGSVVDAVDVATLTAEPRSVRHQGVERAVSFAVVARTRRGVRSVVTGLPTEAHATRVSETLTEHLAAPK